MPKGADSGFDSHALRQFHSNKVKTSQRGTMKKCGGHCGFEYPEEILSKMFVSESGKSGYTEPICGVCALDISNRLHGDNRTSFNGEVAEHNRQMALKVRLALKKKGRP